MRCQLLFQVEYFYTECLETHVEAGFTYLFNHLSLQSSKTHFQGKYKAFCGSRGSCMKSDKMPPGISRHDCCIVGNVGAEFEEQSAGLLLDSPWISGTNDQNRLHLF